MKDVTPQEEFFPALFSLLMVEYGDNYTLLESYLKYIEVLF